MRAGLANTRYLAVVATAESGANPLRRAMCTSLLSRSSRAQHTYAVLTLANELPIWVRKMLVEVGVMDGKGRLAITEERQAATRLEQASPSIKLQALARLVHALWSGISQRLLRPSSHVFFTNMSSSLRASPLVLAV